MSRKAVIATLITAAVIGIVAVVVYFLTAKPTVVPRRPEGFPFGGVRLPAEKQPPAREIVTKEKPEEASKREFVLQIFGSTVTLPTPLVEELRPVLSIAERIFKPEKKEELPESFLGLTSPIGPGEQELTPQDVFRTLYPEFYISALKKIQGVLVEEGAVKADQQLLFANEQEIKDFNDTLFGFLRARGAISEADYQGYIRGRDFLFNRPYEKKYREAQDIILAQSSGALRAAEETLPSKEAAEKQVRELLKSQGLPETFELLPEPSACAEKKDSISGNFSLPVAIFYYFVERGVIPEANAAIFCFRFGAKGIGGTNFVTPCCSCKMKGTPVGCLDICPASAIWDPITNICGCNSGGITGP